MTLARENITAHLYTLNSILDIGFSFLSVLCIKAEPPLSKPCDIVNDIKNESRLMAWLLVIATCMLSSFGMM